MSLRIRYSDPRGIDEPAVMTSIASNVRYGDLMLTQSAEQGSPSMSTVTIEDPGAGWTFNGLRAMEFAETSAASNNQIIGRFAIADRTVRRSPQHGLITGTDREWAVDMVDYNWHGGKRVLVDSDSKRPAETAGDRVRWLLASAANVNLNDYGNVQYPTNAMDATDYRGQRATDVLNDCAIEPGYLWWVDYNEAHGRPELFFINADSGRNAASIAISNVMADVDGVTTFYPSEDATLRRSASRLAYGVYLAYTNGAVYVRNDAIAQQYGALDQTAPMSNVKTAARARRVATKFLNDNADESDVITCSITVPAAQVNDIRQGQVVGVRFQHLPGYETATACRVIRRTVIQDVDKGQDWYRLQLEMVPGGQLPFTGPAFVALIGNTDIVPGVSTGFAWTGDSVTAPGWYEEPAVTAYFTPNLVGGYYTSVTCTQDMTVRLSLMMNGNGVSASFSTTLSLTVNGVAVASDTQSYGGGVAYYQRTWSMDVYGVRLHAGDVISWAWSGSFVPGIITYTPNTSWLRIGRGTFTWNTGHDIWTGY